MFFMCKISKQKEAKKKGEDDDEEECEQSEVK